MKRLIRASKSGRPLSNSMKWKIINIDIVIYSNNAVINSAISSNDPEDIFFSTMIEHLEIADYLPYLSLPTMQRMFSSSYSNSEYYVFLKVDGYEHVKLVLDIRFANHPSPQYGSASAHDRHVRFMQRARIPDVSQTGFDTSETQPDFIDVEFNSEPSLEIVIDGQSSYSVEDALDVLDARIAQLP